jgi:hypothetical protein
MGTPANIYAQDTHAVEPVLVKNWGNPDNASVESSFYSLALLAMAALLFKTERD